MLSFPLLHVGTSIINVKNDRKLCYWLLVEGKELMNTIRNFVEEA